MTMTRLQSKKSPALVRAPSVGGWTAHYLARGYHVTTYLHDASEIGPLTTLLDTAWESLCKIGLGDGASRDNFRWTTSLEEGGPRTPSLSRKAFRKFSHSNRTCTRPLERSWPPA